MRGVPTDSDSTAERPAIHRDVMKRRRPVRR
jgi:hypothetical protein